MYVFRLMTYDEYYDSHEAFKGDGDRRSISEIDASAARAVSRLRLTTTLSSVCLLFRALVYSLLTAREGILSLFITTANTGMMIIQCILILGGPVRYL